MNKFKRRVCIFSSFPNGNNTFGNRKNASENREAVLFDHLVRSNNSQRSFYTFSPIGRDFTRYQLEKNSRGETKQEVIKLGQLLETGFFFFFFFFFFEREREKGSKHGRDVFRKTNEISFHERGRHRRKGMLLCVVTCEQSLSSMYIRALMEFPV